MIARIRPDGRISIAAVRMLRRRPGVGLDPMGRRLRSLRTTVSVRRIFLSACSSSRLFEFDPDDLVSVDGRL